MNAFRAQMPTHHSISIPLYILGISPIMAGITFHLNRLLGVFLPRWSVNTCHSFAFLVSSTMSAQKLEPIKTIDFNECVDTTLILSMRSSPLELHYSNFS